FNTIDNDIAAYVADVPSVDTAGGDVIVRASDESTIDAFTVAAAVSVALGGGSTGVAIAGGGAVAQNVILTRVNSSIENSTLGRDGEDHHVGAVDLDAIGHATIDATVGAVAASIGVGSSTGAAVAIGIGVARNFIGYDPNGAVDEADIDYASTFENSVGLQAGTLVDSLSSGMTVRISDGPLRGDVYEYVGPTVSDSDTET